MKNDIDKEIENDPNWSKIYEGPEELHYAPFWLKVCGMIGAIAIIATLIYLYR